MRVQRTELMTVALTVDWVKMSEQDAMELYPLPSSTPVADTYLKN
jgi:hypothetical protein